MLKYSKLFVNSVLLFTTPSIVLYPQDNQPKISFPAQKVSFEEKQPEKTYTLSYDEIIRLIDEIESGELEKKCTPEDLERIKHFLVFLAKEGALPDGSEESLSLDNDIEELLNNEDDSIENDFSYEAPNEYQYTIIPAVLGGQYEIVLCKGWVKKQWRHVKKFAKKHKKALILGAAVIVAATAVVVVVAAASAEAAGAAVASAAGSAAAAANGGSARDEKTNSEASNEQASTTSVITSDPSIVMTAANEAPILKSVIVDRISTFKETVSKEDLMQVPNSSKDHEDAALEETARNLGAHFAHETLDGISELTSCVPQLLQEIKDIGHKVLPEGLLHSNPEGEIAPVKNFENLVAAGHEKIDEIFSTDQDDHYTPEAKEARNKFAVGILPPPEMLANIPINKLIDGGKTIDRAGFTKAGRALMKHGYREGSVFPKPLGRPAQINEHGQMILEEILNDPKKELFITGEGGLKIYSSSGQGAHFKKDGTFKGFIERQYE